MPGRSLPSLVAYQFFAKLFQMARLGLTTEQQQRGQQDNNKQLRYVHFEALANDACCFAASFQFSWNPECAAVTFPFEMESLWVWRSIRALRTLRTDVVSPATGPILYVPAGFAFAFEIVLPLLPGCPEGILSHSGPMSLADCARSYAVVAGQSVALAQFMDSNKITVR